MSDTTTRFDRLDYKTVRIGPKKIIIPTHWDVSQIRNLAEYISGTTFPREYQGFDYGDLPFYKVGDMNNSRIWMNSANNYISDADAGEIGANVARPGTIIFPKLGQALLTNKRRILTECSIFDNNVAGVEAKNMNKYFLFYWLSKIDFDSLSNHGTVPSLNKSAIESIRLPVPPLPEQRRIAEILSTVDELIHQTDAVIEETKRLKRGLMQDLLTKGIGHESFQKVQIGPKNIKIPSSWCVVDLAQIADIKGGKRLPKEHNFSDEVTSYPYLRVSDFQNQSINTKNLKYLKERTAEKLNKYIISENDLFISIAGTIGKVGTIPNHLDNSYLTENAAKIRITGGIDNGYLQYYLLSYIAQNEFDRRSIVTTQPKLSLYNIRSMPCFLPSMHEQKEIAKRLSAVDDTIQKEQQIKTKLEALKRGLMQDLLTGKVRVPVET